MQNRKRIVMAAIGICLALPGMVTAQESSINAFSPYTFYGLGDLTTQGTAYIRSMGGAGVAYRSRGQINYLNPASASAVARQTFLFNFGAEGQNYYLQSNEGKSSFNSFNLRDIAIQMPLYRGVGFTMSVTPFSSVGYRVSRFVEDTEIEGEFGQVNQVYSGEGDVTQAKAGVGWAIVPRLSVGAEMIYYFGSINRFFGMDLTPITGTGSYVSTAPEQRERISRVFANFGVQYDLIATQKRFLTLGATFQPEGALKPRIERNIISGYDTVRTTSWTSDFTLPSMLTVGAFYHTPKMSLGADYTYQNWGSQNQADQTPEITFVDTHSIKVGGQYTPDAGDIRHFLNRWTYRAGVRYSTYYMKLRGEQIDDRAVTFGVGVPLRMGGYSDLNVGLEYGQRGTTRQGLVKENYFKISIGLSLFSTDWFVKPKYD